MHRRRCAVVLRIIPGFVISIHIGFPVSASSFINGDNSTLHGMIPNRMQLGSAV